MDNISKPSITEGEEVLVKVGADGLCHSDLHIINGEWKDMIPLNLPKNLLENHSLCIEHI
jgi:alcohol dehydrogenase, propanol-preferring